MEELVACTIFSPLFCFPLPLADLGKVEAVFGDILVMLNKSITHLLKKICAPVTKLRQMINDVHYKVEPVDLILDPHIERCCDGTLFKVAVYA